MKEKPDRRAAALRYDREQDPAPRLLAGGRGWVAEEIMRRAREQGIPLVADAALVEVLSQLDIGTVIPEDLYRPLAEILAHIYMLDNKYGGVALLAAELTGE